MILFQLVRHVLKTNQKSKKELKPIRSKNFNERVQVDLIDYQASPDGEYKYIMVYQDHFTKFVQLQPLKSKTANEVKKSIEEIFDDFGPPKILHTDNGREFKNSLIDSFINDYPGLSIVHGRPRHSQSQGSVERANQDVEHILCAWMADNTTKEWVLGVRKVQAIKNNRYHSTLKNSPYKCLFGVDYLQRSMESTVTNISSDEDEEFEDNLEMTGEFL